MIDYGMLVMNNFDNVEGQPISKVTGYFIMPKYSVSLEEYLDNASSIDLHSVLSIIRQLIDALEAVHMAGRIYNDLKPENIMVNKGEDGELHVKLIDFGFASKYITPQGCHIDDLELLDKFRGNIMFSSLDQMEFKPTSRKDDMVSLCYMMLYMLSGLQMPGFGDYKEAL